MTWKPWEDSERPSDRSRLNARLGQSLNVSRSTRRWLGVRRQLAIVTGLAALGVLIFALLVH